MDPTQLSAWDQAGLALAHAARAPWLDAVFAAITWLGSLAVLLPLALLLWWRCAAATGTPPLSRWP
jgi:hypothetical protein